MNQGLSKADRLTIGGAVAPVVRTAAARVITLLDKSGTPSGKTTSVEVSKGLLARCGIEFSVQDGKRPSFVACKRCGRPIKVGDSGPVATVCRSRTQRCRRGKVPVARVRSPRKAAAPARCAVGIRLTAEDLLLIDKMVEMERDDIKATIGTDRCRVVVTRATLIRAWVREAARARGLDMTAPSAEKETT